MKINALHISAFGGIKNLDLNFDNGFNIVYGENENGKTTVMAFIKMMFYGSERTSAQLSKSPRKKYQPWDQSQMGGSIDFETDGRAYRIERIFGNSNSTDKVTLIDLGLGTRTAVSADIGTELFGLSAAAFERSIFIGQFGYPESNNIAIGELNGKLSNITLTGDETVSFDKVYERVSNAKFSLMSKSGRSGEYDKNLKAKKELEDELEKSVEKMNTVQKYLKANQLLNTEINSLEAKLKTLKAQIDSENDFRNAEKLKELLNLKAELQEFNKKLTLSDGTLADEMFVTKVEFCLSKIERIMQKISAKQNENSLLENNLKLALNPGIDATPEKEKEIREKLSKAEAENGEITKRIEELETLKKPKPNYTLLIISIVLLIVSGGLFLINPLITYIGLPISVALIIIGILVVNKAKKTAKSNETELLNLKLKQNQNISLIASEKANLTAITTALNSNAAIIENQKSLLEKGNAEINELNESIEAEKQTLYALISSLTDTKDIAEIKTILENIKADSVKQKEIKQNINYILKDVGNISYTEALEKLKNIKTDSNVNFPEIKKQYDLLLGRLTDYKSKSAALTAECNSITASHKNPENIKTEIEDLEKTIKSQKDYCDCLDIILETLTDSYAEVRKSYGTELEKSAGEIFNGLTGGKYQDMSISKSFEISVTQTDVFGSLELEYLSSGTQDQAYLALRLALAKLMAHDRNALPVILDDSLAQYDDKRSQTALAFLKEYSADGQILLFTCHNSVVNMAQKTDANIIAL